MMNTLVIGLTELKKCNIYGFLGRFFKKQEKIYTDSYIKGDYKEIEVGFVDSLFEMYKLRELIAKAYEEILSKEMMNSYNHSFGTGLYTSIITFRSTTIN